MVDYGRQTSRLREAWENNPNLYEGNPYMNIREWERYQQDTYNPSARPSSGRYWEDPEPWGDERPGGAVLKTKIEVKCASCLLTKYSAARGSHQMYDTCPIMMVFAAV